jgi:hypothetical protein
MYNMDISILGYKLNVEILILIGVVYLILVGHTVCGCSNVRGVVEGLENIASGKKVTATSTSAASTPNPTNALLGTQVSSGVAPTMANTKEGFTGSNTNYGLSAPYSLASDKSINTSSWFTPNLTISPGKPLSQGVNNILNRPQQPIPLPQGELLMFANTPFKPECCPNTYSTGSGCACMTVGQYNYLINRGGNNVPYSEY